MQVELISASVLCGRARGLGPVPGGGYAYLYCDGAYAWAVALGVISALFTGIVLLLSNVAAGSVEPLLPFFAIFIAVWWSFGLIFTTFSLSAPFSTCSNMNGFVAVWTAFVTSWSFAYSSYGNRPFVGGSSSGAGTAGGGGGQPNFANYGGQPHPANYAAPPPVFGYNTAAPAAAPTYGAYEPPVPPMASEYQPEKGNV